MAIVPKVATLKVTGGTPEIEIVVETAHQARYQLLLLDEMGGQPTGIGSPDGHGVTGAGRVERFELAGPVSGLHRRSVFWQAALAGLAHPGAPASFAATVRLLQGGQVVSVDGGTGTRVSGQFNLKVQP